MSGYILCQTKKAEHPYFIRNISTNIYSIEELCYYLYHNLYLIDGTIINEGLCNWLSEELGLVKLAEKLAPFMGKFASAEDILYPIFKEINYLSYEELRTLNSQLSGLDREDPAVREKRKGDALMENRMYVNAIQVYQKLLEREGLEQVREGFISSVYHNLGCAYSYLFQMEKAVECFWKAYTGNQTDGNLKCYLLAYRNGRTAQELESRMKQLSADEDLKKEIRKIVGDFEKRPEEHISEEQMDAMLAGFTKEYHRSTGS